MCLGIPGKLVEIHQQDDLPMGRVEFGGILKNVCLSYTPDAQVGDYVLVHVGFALSRIDEEEAQETFRLLEEIAEFGDQEAGIREQTSLDQNDVHSLPRPPTPDP